VSADPTKHSVAGRLGRWSAELILVFIGVYAAFWLNNYQEHQRDAKRRDVILVSLEQDVQGSIESARQEAATEGSSAIPPPKNFENDSRDTPRLSKIPRNFFGIWRNLKRNYLSRSKRSDDRISQSHSRSQLSVLDGQE
jgi:hypothetical protein